MNYEKPPFLADYSANSLHFVCATYASKPYAIGFGTGHLVSERAYYRLSEIPFREVRSEEDEFFEWLADDVGVEYYPTCTTWRFFLPF